MKIQELTHDQIIKKATPLPDACGIYFLVKGDTIVYVGQSITLFSRLYMHRDERTKEFDRYTFLKCLPHQLAEFERYYIRKFQPLYNKTHKPKLPRKGPARQRENNVEVVTPLGFFPSIAMAAAFHGICRELVTLRIKREMLGWSKFSTEKTLEIQAKRRPGRPRKNPDIGYFRKNLLKNHVPVNGSAN